MFQMAKGRLFVFFAVMTVATDSGSASLFFKQPYGVTMCDDLCRSLTECGAVSYVENSLACDLRTQTPSTRGVLDQTRGHFTEDGQVNDRRRMIVSRGGQRVFVSFGVKTQEPPTATVPKRVELKSTTSTESRYPKIQPKRMRVNSKPLDVLSMSPSLSHRNIMYLLTRSNRQYYIQVVNIITSQLLAYRYKLRDREGSTPAQLYNGTCVRNASRTCVHVLYVARLIYAAALEEDQLRPQLQEDTNIRVPSLYGAPTFCFTFKSSEVYCLNIGGMYMLDCNGSTCLIRHLPQTLWLPFSLTDVKIDPYTWDRVVTVSKYAVNVAIFDHDNGTFTNAELLQIRCKTVAWFNFFMYYFE